MIYESCWRVRQSHNKEYTYLPLETGVDTANGPRNGRETPGLKVLAPVVVASYYLVGLPAAAALAWPARLGTVGLALGATVGDPYDAADF